jgi:dienelactone hydrolase
MRRSKLFKFLLKAAAVIITLGVVGTATFLVLLWREHRTEITLPAPTGRFAVGRTTYAWVNDAQVDEFAPTPGAKRQVLVWMWYPSAGAQSAPSEYVPAYRRLALSRSSVRSSWPARLNDDFLTRDPTVVHAHSSSDPPISSEQNSYPVVIMRAGLGALTTDFTTLAEDMASHGYVVVGFDAPYRTGVVVFPDGRIFERPPQYNPETLSQQDAERLAYKLVTMWSDDTRFVVDQLGRLNTADPTGRFIGRLDLKRLGMFGHSLGGATALQFCHDDARCKAGINIDGAPFGSVVREGATQPFLFLFENADFSSPPKDPQVRKMFADIRFIYDHLNNGRFFLAVRGANHFSFGDVMLLKSHYIVRGLQLLTGGLEVSRGLTITAACVHTFFDVYLKNQPVTLLDDLRQAYPEIQSFPPQF